MSEEANAILEEAYRMLAEGALKWYQGSNAPRGSGCTVNALTHAQLRLTPLADQALTEAADRVREVIGTVGIAGWNDDPHTTKSDVLLALKRARWDFGDDG